MPSEIPAQYIFKHNSFTRPSAATSGDALDVLKYTIDLELFPIEHTIAGKTIILFTAQSTSLKQISLDFVGLVADSVFQQEQKTEFIQDMRGLSLTLNSSIALHDTSKVTIFYHGHPVKGIYFRYNLYGDQVVYSHNEPYDVRHWIPCKDDPSDKALLDIRVTVPDAYVVLSNGMIMADELISVGKRRFFWQEQYPIATYLISMAAAPYAIARNRFTYLGMEMPVAYYVYPEDQQRAEETLEWTLQMLHFYSDYIGIYPFFEEKYNMSEVPFREAGAMENQTATTMSDSRFDDENVIAHELAHQWWGDALTPVSFADIWLNEGFATYFDALFTEYKYGREEFENRMLQMVSRVDTDGSLDYPIYGPPDRYLFGSAVYLKGAWVLHMLRYEVGDDPFRQICRRYYDTYKYHNVVTSDFVRVCEEISGKSLEQFFNQWLMYSGMPVIHGTWVQKDDVIEVTITQTQEEPLYQFNLELLLKLSESDTLITLPFFQESQVLVLNLAAPLVEVIIDPDHKILNNNNGPVFHMPSSSSLLKTYPNPFNSEVHISFKLHKVQTISIEIFSLTGQKVTEIYQGKGLAGINEIVWHSLGQASGIYFCRLNYQGGSDIRKLVMIK
jgi:aminopeptidase N